MMAKKSSINFERRRIFFKIRNPFFFCVFLTVVEQGGPEGESDEDAALPREGHKKFQKQFNTAMKTIC